MFKAEWSYGTDDFARIAPLRASAGVCGDRLDPYCVHAFVFEEDGTAIAAGRMHPEGDAVVIDGIAVAPEYRAMPYAEFTLRLLLFKGQDSAQTYIDVQKTDGIVPLLPRFGFAELEEKPGFMRVRRDAINWFSQCRDDEEKRKNGLS